MTGKGGRDGATGDVALTAAVEGGKKHGISQRTIERAKAKLQGKTPAPPKPKPAATKAVEAKKARGTTAESSTPTPAAAKGTNPTPQAAVGDLLNALFHLKQKHGEATVRRALATIVSSPNSAWCLDQRGRA